MKTDVDNPLAGVETREITACLMGVGLGISQIKAGKFSNPAMGPNQIPVLDALVELLRRELHRREHDDNGVTRQV